MDNDTFGTIGSLLVACCCSSLPVIGVAVVIYLWLKNKSTPKTPEDIERDMEKKLHSGRVGELIISLSSGDARIRKAAVGKLIVVVTLEKSKIGGYLKLLVERLINTLKDEPDPEVRENIIILLGLLKEESRESLLKEREKSGGAARVRLTSALALDDPGESARLMQCVSDPDPAVRRAAVEDLGPMGEPNAKPLLTSALDDADEAVREAADVALRRFTQIENRQAKTK